MLHLIYNIIKVVECEQLLEAKHELTGVVYRFVDNTGQQQKRLNDYMQRVEQQTYSMTSSMTFYINPIESSSLLSFLHSPALNQAFYQLAGPVTLGIYQIKEHFIIMLSKIVEAQPSTHELLQGWACLFDLIRNDTYIIVFKSEKKHQNIIIKMQKALASISKNNVRQLLSLSEFNALRQNNQSVLTVEIEKQPSTLLRNSLWVGHRNGGMASWLGCLLPHLPQTKFCLYMNENSYKGSEYMYSYYSEYFSKLFHKEYMGTFIGSRNLFNQKEMVGLNEIKASKIREQLLNRFESRPTVFFDFRNADALSKDCLSRILPKYRNASVINVPLNDDDFTDLLHAKTSHLPSRVQLITMCAKGYRSTIGYTMLNLIKKPEWDIQVCRNSFADIKEQLNKESERKVFRSPAMQMNSYQFA